MSTVVKFEERQTACGKRLGIARLNSEKSLNALSLEMIQQLQPQLDSWAGDDEIACVWLEGAGEKAFCAAWRYRCNVSRNARSARRIG